MKFIDTHCHPYLLKTKNLEDVFLNFKKLGGTHMISIGVDLKTSEQSIDLSKKNDFIFASAGIHPCDTKKYIFSKKHSLEELEKLINEKNLVAIGETGLDFYWPNKDFEKSELPQEKKEINLKNEIETQKYFFIEHIKLAKKYDLPIIIHNRYAKVEVLEILMEQDFKNFIFHCYSENLDYAEQLIKFSPNCKISFSGIVTFKNGQDIQNTAKHIPLKNILVETDSPYLTPVPYRGKEENEPGYTKFNLEKVIELRNESRKTIIEQIYKNSKEVFKI